MIRLHSAAQGHVGGREPHAIAGTLVEIRDLAILPGTTHRIDTPQERFVNGHLRLFRRGAEHTRQFPVKETAELLCQKGIFLSFRPHREQEHEQDDERDQTENDQNIVLQERREK